MVEPLGHPPLLSPVVRAILDGVVPQPTGTVTFMFSDIDSSTRLLAELGRECYAGVLDEHRRLLRAAFAAHGGYEVDCEGDSFFVAFQSAREAAAASAEAQQALAGGPVLVRMGLHTGEALVAPPKYVGLDVHRAARIMAAAHGGQVLLSQATADLVAGALRDDQCLRDLGEHRLKDLAAPERIYQVGDGEYPPLLSLYRTNLPVPATPFLGRAEELAEVIALLHRDDLRLVTLTGPGGTGKTRLALQATAEAAESFPDGLWWVPLAPLRDSAHIVSTVADALQLKEQPDRELTDALAQALAGKRALVLLDNAEHLLPGVAETIGRLRDVGGVTILVTSRERLRLRGEHTYPVPPLHEQDGIELLLTTAAAAGVRIESTETVRELCARLDYLPLALELAAGRTPLFSPEQLLERLSQRLDLLEGGRDADPRQQTLRATIEWSHELLTENEKQLFRRLSLFSGGCTLEAAEQVCEARPDTLQSLLDKNLVRRRDTSEKPRYWMLETIREYAAESLEEAGETDQLGRRHAEHFLELVESARPARFGPFDLVWVERLDEEYDNLRAALAWSDRTAAVETNARLGAALAEFWRQRGHFADARGWLENAVTYEIEEPGLRARVLCFAGLLAFLLGDWNRGESLSAEALAVYRDLGDIEGVGQCLNTLGGCASAGGQNARGREFLEECRRLAQEVGLTRLVAVSTTNLADLALKEERYDEAVVLNTEALDLFRRVGSGEELQYPLLNLGFAALFRAQFGQAGSFLREGLELARERRNPVLGSSAIAGLAMLAEASGAIQKDAAARRGASPRAACRRRGDVVRGRGSLRPRRREHDRQSS